MSRLAARVPARADATLAHTRYGPFWIAATLVFIAAAAGNLSAYLAYIRLAGTTPDAVWAYDIKKVSLSAVLFYGYISFLPLAVRCWAARRSPGASAHKVAADLPCAALLGYTN